MHKISPKMGSLTQKLNFNVAPEDELSAIPGVGPAMARRIIAERPFQEVAELERVPGIGPILLDRMKPFVTLDNESPDELTYDLLAAADPVVEDVIEAEVIEVELDVPYEEETVDELDLILEAEVVEAEVDVPSDEEVEVEEVEEDLEPVLIEEITEEPVETFETEPVEEAEPVVAPMPVAAAPNTLTRGQAFGLALEPVCCPSSSPCLSAWGLSQRSIITNCSLLLQARSML